MKQYFINWILGGGGALLLSLAARALPEPVPMGNKFYAWLYNFAHLLLANPDRRIK